MEIDKRLQFQKVLGLEYALKVQKYSNTEFIVKSWIMVCIGIVGFFVAFFGIFFSAFKSEVKEDSQIVSSTLNDVNASCNSSLCQNLLSMFSGSSLYKNLADVFLAISTSNTSNMRQISTFIFKKENVNQLLWVLQLHKESKFGWVSKGKAKIFHVPILTKGNFFLDTFWVS